MSRELCRDVPDSWGCSKSLCQTRSCAFFVPYPGTSAKAQGTQPLTLVLAVPKTLCDFETQQRCHFVCVPKVSQRFFRALPNGGGTERGVCGIYVARACADARHTNDAHAFPQTTLFVVSKPRLIASSARHLLATKKKRTPHLGPPPIKSSQSLRFFLRFSGDFCPKNLLRLFLGDNLQGLKQPEKTKNNPGNGQFSLVFHGIF